VETVSVERAFRRVSSQQVLASRDIPELPTSHMDGYAVRSRDLETASSKRPAILKLIAAVGPGSRLEHAIGRGETVQVATGAVLPSGADAVVPKERAVVRGSEVAVNAPTAEGSYVYAVGEDFKRGNELVAKGRQLRAQDVGLLVGLGLSTLKVWSKPRVTVIATGSELTRSTKPTSGKIRESHSHVFMHLIGSLGSILLDGGVVGDDPTALAKALRKALASSDFVITLGGTSAGGRDIIVDTTSTLRPSVLVHGIKLDRGRVTGVACVDGKPILMMPGPIQAAMNAFLVLGTPIIETLSGRNGASPEFICTLGKDWLARKRFSDFEKVVYVRLKIGDENLAEPLSAETESMRLLTDSDAYLVVPEETTRLAAGSLVRVRLVPGFSEAL